MSEPVASPQAPRVSPALRHSSKAPAYVGSAPRLLDRDAAAAYLSISVDTDQGKWKDFIAKNEMTWPQSCDNGFTGPVTKLFGVNSIPHTFTIDADGVLQEEHVGDASIEGKLKKLLARARELQPAETSPK
jgi:peroxiredoxin